MKKLKLLILITSLGCTGPSPTPAPAFYAQVYYKTQAGIDMLNPASTPHYAWNEVNISDLVLVNGIRTLRPSMIDSSDCKGSICPCKGYLCEATHPDDYHIQYYFTPTVNSVGTVIKLSATETDTLFYKIVPAPSGTSGYIVENISLKGKVIWTASANNNHLISVVK